jgi:predicted RNase H-like HicB family nuclease
MHRKEESVMRSLKEICVFPAIFTYEEGYDIAVTFPDFPGCATSGADEMEALLMARDALFGRIRCMISDNEEIPEPTKLRTVELEDTERAVLVDVPISRPLVESIV